MTKMRLFADLVALSGAALGLSAAYLQYEENQSIKAVSASAQSQLVEAAKGGEVDLAAVDATIKTLGKVTGRSPSIVIPLAAPASTGAPLEPESQMAPPPAPELKRGVLRLDEGQTLDLFKEGEMYTVDEISGDRVFLRGANSNRLNFSVGDRESVPGTGCSMDLLKTHPDETFKKKGWAEFRTWCE